MFHSDGSFIISSHLELPLTRGAHLLGKQWTSATFLCAQTELPDNKAATKRSTWWLLLEWAVVVGMGRLILYGWYEPSHFLGVSLSCDEIPTFDWHLLITQRQAEDAYIVSPSYLWLYFSSALSFKGSREGYYFFFFKCCYDFTDTGLGKWSCSSAFMRILRK